MAPSDLQAFPKKKTGNGVGNHKTYTHIDAAIVQDIGFLEP